MYVLYLSEREIREVKSNIGRSIYYTQRYAYQDRVDVGQLITQCQFFFILYKDRFVKDLHTMILRKWLALNTAGKVCPIYIQLRPSKTADWSIYAIKQPNLKRLWLIPEKCYAIFIC